jgi:hypothetical protein
MAQLLTVGLLGEPDRISTWEQYLRPHASVGKVVLTKDLKALGSIDACIILDEQEGLSHAYSLARQRIHVFFVGKLPTDLPMLIRLQNTIEESRSVLQFSNWSYFNPVSLWMLEHLPRPRLLHTTREVMNTFADPHLKLDNLWIEDLALTLRWINSGIHKIDTHMIQVGNYTLSRNTWIQFENGATATLFHTMQAESNRHVRFAFDERIILEANILDKNVIGSYIDNDETFKENRSFTKELPADQAISRFLKAIQMQTKSEYGVHDVLHLVRTMAKANSSFLR